MPKGPAGGRRPFANAPIVMEFHIDEPEAGIRGRSVENTLRRNVLNGLDVQIAESNRPVGEIMIRVFTRRENITVTQQSVLVEHVKSMLEQDVRNSNIIVSTE